MRHICCGAWPRRAGSEGLFRIRSAGLCHRQYVGSARRWKLPEKVDPLEVALKKASTRPRIRPKRRISKKKQPEREPDDSSEDDEEEGSTEESEASAECVIEESAAPRPEPSQPSRDITIHFFKANRRAQDRVKHPGKPHAGCAAPRSPEPWLVCGGSGTRASHTHS